MPVPHDSDAEDALLSDMLHDPGVVPDVAQSVVPGDFYQPRAGAAYAALVEAHRLGEPLDIVALHACLVEAGADPDPAWLAGLPGLGWGGWRKHAQVVIAHRVRRDIVAAAHPALNDALDPTVDPLATLDELQAALGRVHVPDGTPPKDLHTLDEFIDRPEHEQAPWVVPGLLRSGWRVVIVGFEGQGKSWLWRQFAVLAAQGLHPLGFERIEPVRTLLVDLENPADAITENCLHLRTQVQRKQGYTPGRAWIWHRPQGVDLRTRTGRSDLAAVCAATKPQLVCLGPLYKAYHRGKDSDEEAAAEVQSVLDDLRTRYGFALLLEHHAPQDSQGFRKLRPYGSSLWLRWPELGIAMQPIKDQPGAMLLERWRGDRMTSMWPERIERGPVWPWNGAWSDDAWRHTLPGPGAAS